MPERVYISKAPQDRRLLLKLLEGVDFRGRTPEPITAHAVL